MPDAIQVWFVAFLRIEARRNDLGRFLCEVTSAGSGRVGEHKGGREAFQLLGFVRRKLNNQFIVNRLDEWRMLGAAVLSDFVELRICRKKTEN